MFRIARTHDVTRIALKDIYFIITINFFNLQAFVFVIVTCIPHDPKSFKLQSSTYIGRAVVEPLPRLQLLPTWRFSWKMTMTTLHFTTQSLSHRVLRRRELPN
jgi:hypothetical protein